MLDNLMLLPLYKSQMADRILKFNTMINFINNNQLENKKKIVTIKSNVK